ncbi:MAG: HEAT repeat domain-containing protein [Planctomycetes bacterium]|nr:HEAT repeat domain-containing protein [Planctomycetota bacterium]
MSVPAFLLISLLVLFTGQGKTQGKPKEKPAPEQKPEKPELPLEGELPRDVPLLIEFLKSEKPAVRRRAAEGLRALGPDAKEAIPVLIIRTHDDADAQVRKLCAEALAEMGPLSKNAVIPLSKGLFDKDSDVRVASAAALGKIGVAALGAFDALLKTAKQDGAAEPLQNACITAAGAILSKLKDDAPRKVYLTKLAELLGDARPSIRKTTVEEIGALGRAAKETLPRLRDLAENDADDDVKKAAADAVARVSGETEETGHPPTESAPSAGVLTFATFDAVLEALKNNKATVRREAVERIIKMKSAAEPAIATIKKMLHDDEDLPVRVGAARALEAMGPVAEPAVKELGLSLTNRTEDERVRAASADALGAIGPRALPAQSALARAWVEDERGAVRRAASHSLFQKIQASPRNIVNIVRDIFVSSKEEDVRARCADAFGQLGVVTKETLAILTKCLKDEEPIVRRSAAAALGEIGTEAKSCVAALMDARKDTDPNVKKRAEFAIRKIDPLALPPDPPPVTSNPVTSKPAAPDAPASEPAASAVAKEPKTLEEWVLYLIDGEAGMSRPTAKFENGGVHLLLTLEHPRFDEAMAHTDAVRLSLKLFESLPDLKAIKVSIFHNNGRLLSTKTVTAERAKPFLAIDDPFERRRMRDWWEKIAL